jgi:DNA-binding transcriptional ArsR family regulator
MKKRKSQDPIFVIDNLETLKVIADPLRLQILELLILQAQTVKELGEKLGLTANKLYYHVNQLEAHGLVQVVDTRQIANMIEKTYGATTQELDIDPALLSFTSTSGRENIHSVLISTIDATREDLLRSLQARAFELDQGAPQQPREVLIQRTLSRLSETRATAFKERLAAL